MTDIADQIRVLREANNRLWMSILKIALKHAREETKAAIRNAA